jgi:hypothetical protein
MAENKEYATEVEVHIPTVPYGFIKITSPTAREARLAVEDPETEALRALLVALRAPQEPLGANVTADEVLPEQEALDALKEALGASEAIENSPEGQDAKSAFLAKFGGK